jgi:hypothetical protein
MIREGHRVLGLLLLLAAPLLLVLLVVAITGDPTMHAHNVIHSH